MNVLKKRKNNWKAEKLAIGIIGGTFDPIHTAHLIIAQYIGEILNLEKILFVPSSIPPHKTQAASSDDRYEMVKLAIAGNPFFEVSRVEIDRTGISYTIDTIKFIKKEYKQKIFFIIGADNIPEFHKWHKFEEILKSCEIAIASRSDFNIDSIRNLREAIGEKKYSKLMKNFIFTPIFSISSSEIRNRIKYKKTIKYLGPDLVRE